MEQIFIFKKLRLKNQTKCQEENYYSKKNNAGFQGQSFSNVSSTIEKLLNNYDIRLRPRFGGNENGSDFLKIDSLRF